MNMRHRSNYTSEATGSNQLLRTDYQVKGNLHYWQVYASTLFLILALIGTFVLPVLAQETNGSPEQTEVVGKVFLPLISSNGKSSPPSSGNQIRGVVYYDYNTNGIRESGANTAEQMAETGVGDVTVTALDADGSQCGQTVSSSDPAQLGVYTLSHTCKSSTVNVEFSNLPAGFEDAPTRSANKGNSQFVPALANNVDYGIYRPANFCQGKPQIAISTLQSTQNGGSSSIALFSSAALQGKDAIRADGSAVTQMEQSVAANQSQIGDVYGLAYHHASNSLLAAAFVRSSSLPASAALPLGPGAIYQVPLNGKRMSVLTILPSVGSLSGAGGSVAQSDVGNVGLGDIELSEDGHTLYAVNLGEKKLMILGLQNDPFTVVSTKEQKLPQPVDCAADQTHPFGLGVNNGKVYVGMVCGGPTNADLKGYVYEYAGATLTKKLSFPLTYERATQNTWLNPDGNSVQSFTNWSATPVNGSDLSALSAAAKSAPWLTDIAFDGGDMLLGLRSRWIDQSSSAATTAGGEILRACGNSGYNSSKWSLENNGICGGKSTVNPPAATDPWTGGSHARDNSKGVGGFEYYWGDDGFEGEAVQGNLAQLTGAPYVYVTQSGALGHGGQVGVMALGNQSGAIEAAGNVGSANSGLHSLGDMELICDAPPVEIGNRVWSDTNANGIQDLGEPGLPNLTLELYDDNALVATAVTDADGNYLFRSDPNGDPNPNDSVGLVQGSIDLSKKLGMGATGYQIRIPNLMGPIRQVALRNDVVEVTSSGSEEVQIIDESAAVSLPSSPTYTNHNYDFGIVTTLAGQAAYCSADLANTAAMMKKYNLIVLDDLATSSGVAGRTFVGNNLTSSAVANFGSNLPGFVGNSDNVLVIAGNLVTGQPLTVLAGSARVGGTTNGRTINFTGGSLVSDGSLSDASMTMQLQSASLGMANLSANNSVVLASANNNTVSFNVTAVNDCGMAIFNVNAADLFSNPQAGQIALNPGSAKTIVINVSGTTVSWSSAASLVGNFANSTWRAHVLWNFYQAQTLNFGNHTMMGATLAPFAALTTQSSMEGSVAVRSFGSSQPVNQPEFDGDLSCACAAPMPPSTPLPLTPTSSATPAATPIATPVPTQAPPPSVNGNSVLTVTKQLIGTGSGPFNISIVGSTGYSYNTSISPNTSIVLTGLERGIYTVTEASPGVGWTTYYTAAPGGSGSNYAYVTLLPAVTPLSGVSAISGKVFVDYNSDGLITSNGNVVDNGVAGVSVAVYDPKGVLVGSATTNSNGDYSIAPSKTGPYRVEFSKLPADSMPTTHGAQNGTSTQFVTTLAGASNVNLGINRPCDYCQDNPSLATTRLTAASYTGYGSSGSIYTFSSSDVDLAAQPFLLNATTTNQWSHVSSMSSLSTAASQAMVGNVYGLAWHRSSKTIFSSAFARANLMTNGGIGNGGLGAIYATKLNGTPTTSLLTTVPNVGTFGYGDDNDTGTVGLGDLELSEAQDKLYTINLFERKLVVMTLSGTTPVVSSMNQIVLPVPSGCPAVNVRPFALASNNNKLYIGMTCDGSNGSSMVGYVYEYDGANFVNRLTFPFNYTRPNANVNRYGYYNYPEYLANNLGFINWNTYPSSFGDYAGYQTAAKTQPWLVGLTFDKGDMIIGIRSRLGDARGNGSSGGHFWTTGGDLLRACGNDSYNPTSWSLENNASCGGKSTLPVPSTDPFTGRGSMSYVTMGPGGTSYYWGNIGYEGKPSQGGVAQIPGYTNVFAASVDALTHNGEQGIIAVNHKSGAINAGGNIFYSSDSDGIMKGNALGDLEPLCDPAPIEIGNRVWDDYNGNGVQDAGEPGLNTLTVTLQDATGTVSSTVTSGNGNYYFANLKASTVYTISLNPNQAILAGYKLTVANAQAISGTTNSNHPLLDTRDSDAVMIGGMAIINYTTGTVGQNNHGLDFGFSKPATGESVIRNLAPAPLPGSIGNRVWQDLNGNGIQEGGEPGVNNMVVQLYKDNSASGTPDTLLTSTQTNASGFYTFTNLDAAVSYKVYFTVPINNVFTLKDAPGSTELNDSDANPNGFSDKITLSPGVNAEVGAGIYPLSSVSNRAWYDTNGNGIQEGGEAGMANVVVQLYQDNSSRGTPDTLLAFTQTNATGNYGFAGLNPFLSYRVNFALVANHIFTIKDAPGSTEQNDSDANPNGYTDNFIVPPGTNADIGAGYFMPASISNRVWEDLDGDGNQDAGEPGIPNVVVKLYRDNSGSGSPDLFLASTQSGANGVYAFNNLNASIPYKAYFTLVVDHAFTIKDAISSTEQYDSDAYPHGYTDKILLTPGVNAEVGAGMITAANACTIGDRVWYDLNGNGLQENGEGNVSGIKIELYADSACQSNLITSTTTSNSGGYQFGALPIGDYCMIFSNLPGSWYVSPANQGDDTLDSDPNPLSGGFASLSILKSNMVCKDSSIDLGLWAAGTVTQKAWCEGSNPANNTFDASSGDTVLPNVGMSVYSDTDCNGTADGAPIQSKNSDSNGDATFDNLPVAFSEVAGQRTCYVVAVDTADPDLGSCNKLANGGTTAIELSTNRINTNTQYVTGGGFVFKP